jgi:hypothetical protein
VIKVAIAIDVVVKAVRVAKADLVEVRVVLVDRVAARELLAVSEVASHDHCRND